MTNLDLWQLINRENPSPANFIDAGFYFMIAAALERRAWEGSFDRRPLFFNPYIVMVGTPGVGKSWVMDEVKAILQMLVKKDTDTTQKPKIDPKAYATDITEILMLDNTGGIQPDYLIKFSADATSYEALVRSLAAATVWFTKPDRNIYHYAAMAAIIDEFTSLFTKESATIKDFLLTMFGCGTYRKDTIKHGLQTIQNPYFSLLAGTTPDQINRCKDINILDDGFAARTFFIFANANRFKPPIELPSLDEEQQRAQLTIVAHLNKLKNFFGGVGLAPDAVEWLKVDANIARTNSHPNLQYYYVRRILHIKKVAGLVEFGNNSAPKCISLASVQEAVRTLNRWELMMHHSFENNGLNELAPTATRIEEACAKRGYTAAQLLQMFYHDVSGKQLDTLLVDLIRQNRLFKNPNGTYTKAILKK